MKAAAHLDTPPLPFRRPLAPPRRAWLLGLVASIGVSACAPALRHPPAPPVPLSTRTHWSGRVGLRVDGPRPTRWFAQFTLEGHPERGELLLQGPLGQALGRVTWEPGSALLDDGRAPRHYANLDELTQDLTGTAIPVAAWFAWLHGRQVALDGWHANLERVPEGRLSAHRTRPLPAVDLDLLFEP